MYEDNSVVIVSACRTAIGSFTGVFRSTPAHVLGAKCIEESLKRAKIEPESVSEVIMGQCLTAGQGQNCVRQASLKAGIPVSVPAYGVNMLCGSGLKAVYLGYQAIKSNEATIVVAGGQENMSMANHCALLRPGIKLGTGNLQDSVIIDGLTDAVLNMHMGETAEVLAMNYGVSKDEQDMYAFLSQQKAGNAIKNCYFDKEIVPITVKDGKNEVCVKTDEYPKPETSLEKLKKLKPVFTTSEGTVTAGNASGINDGAAAVVLTTWEQCRNKDLKPMAKILGFSQVGLEPIEMGLGPVDAIKNLIKKIDWTLDEVDLFELNEAFAVQSVLVMRMLNIDSNRINICGGAIALGHPIGCSGARVLVTLLHNLERCNKSKGIAALCIGGGMGIAIAVQRNT